MQAKLAPLFDPQTYLKPSGLPPVTLVSEFQASFLEDEVGGHHDIAQSLFDFACHQCPLAFAATNPRSLRTKGGLPNQLSIVLLNHRKLSPVKPSDPSSKQQSG